jgi:hypothetical protein
MYAYLVWGMVGLGCAIVALQVAQPLALLIISASVGGTMMSLYSALLLFLNRQKLPPEIRVTGYRVVILIWSTLFFGVLAAITIYTQIKPLFS